MDPEQLLIESCRDVEARLREGTLYALVKATGVLRQLLVDDTPLVHHVNKIHRLRLRFTVIDSTIDWDAICKTVGITKPDAEFLGDQFEGALPPGLVRRTLTLDQFLDLRFGRVREATFTVRRVIQFMANVQGGVHLSKPDEKQRLLIDIGETTRALGQHFGLEGLDPVLVATRGIARATLSGLVPLIEAIVAKRPELKSLVASREGPLPQLRVDVAPPKSRTLWKMGKLFEAPPEAPTERGAWTVGLMCPPVEVGAFRATPPMKFDPWTVPMDADNFQKLALALGYGAHKQFQAPEVGTFPPEGIETSLAIVFPVPDAHKPTVLFRLCEADGSDSIAIYFEGGTSTLHFQFKELEVTLDCSWAARLYGFATFNWEPGRISIIYGATPQVGSYRQVYISS